MKLKDLSRVTDRSGGFFTWIKKPTDLGDSSHGSKSRPCLVVLRMFQNADHFVGCFTCSKNDNCRGCFTWSRKLPFSRLLHMVKKTTIFDFASHWQEIEHFRGCFTGFKKRKFSKLLHGPGAKRPHSRAFGGEAPQDLGGGARGASPVGSPAPSHHDNRRLQPRGSLHLGKCRSGSSDWDRLHETQPVSVTDKILGRDRQSLSDDEEMGDIDVDLWVLPIHELIHAFATAGELQLEISLMGPTGEAALQEYWGNVLNQKWAQDYKLSPFQEIPKEKECR